MHGSYVLYIMYMLLEGDLFSYFITGIILKYLNIQTLNKKRPPKLPIMKHIIPIQNPCYLRRKMEAFSDIINRDKGPKYLLHVLYIIYVYTVLKSKIKITFDLTYNCLIELYFKMHALFKDKIK